MGRKDERAAVPRRKANCGPNPPADGCDLAGWMAQLDAAQRRAYAACVRDRIRVLDQVMKQAFGG